MAKRAAKQGGHPPSGGKPSETGWFRPGFLSMPAPANDNRFGPRGLLRRPAFWVALAVFAAVAAYALLRS